jgi:hypothetical protein
MGFPGFRVMTRRWTRLWKDFFVLIDRRLEQDRFAGRDALELSLMIAFVRYIGFEFGVPKLVSKIPGQVLQS